MNELQISIRDSEGNIRDVTLSSDSNYGGLQEDDTLVLEKLPGQLSQDGNNLVIIVDGVSYVILNFFSMSTTAEPPTIEVDGVMITADNFSSTLAPRLVSQDDPVDTDNNLNAFDDRNPSNDNDGQDNLGGNPDFIATFIASNQPPVAAADNRTLTEDSDSLLINLLANDFDPEGNNFLQTGLSLTGTIGIVTQNGNGFVTYSPNGMFDYLNPGEIAFDSFTYTITDVWGASSTGTVTITILGLNDAPVLNGTNDFPEIYEDLEMPIRIQLLEENSNNGMSVKELIAEQVADVDNNSVEGIAVTDPDNSNGQWQYSTDGGESWSNLGNRLSDTRARLLAADDEGMNRVRFMPDEDYNGEASLTFRAWDQTSGENGRRADVSNNGGTTAFSAETATAMITVIAVNDPPVIEQPDRVVGLEDNIIPIEGIRIRDVDVNETENGEIGVRLRVAEGNLSVRLRGDAEFAGESENNSDELVIVGSLRSVNRTLRTLEYEPDENWNGLVNLRVGATDFGNTGEIFELPFDFGITRIWVRAVNDAPEIHFEPEEVIFAVPNGEEEEMADFWGNEDESFGLRGLSVSDVDVRESDTPFLRVRLDVNEGELSLEENRFTLFVEGGEEPSSTVIFFGTLRGINMALDTLEYQGNENFNGEDTLTVRVNDLGNTGLGGPMNDVEHFTIDVHAVNDAPVIHFEEPQRGADFNVREDVLARGNLQGISVSDVDVDETEGGTLAIVLSVENGNLFIGLAGDAEFSRGTENGDSRIIIVGTQDDLNNSLNSLSYRGNENFNGEDTLSMLVTDRGNTGPGAPQTDSRNFGINVIAVNDAPMIHFGEGEGEGEGEPNILQIPIEESDFSGNEDRNISLGGISVSDVDVNETEGGTLGISLSVNNGSLFIRLAGDASFARGTGNGEDNLVIVGTLKDLNTSLNSLTYRGNENYNGDDTLSMMVTDRGNTGLGSPQTDERDFSIDVQAVNDAPVIHFESEEPEIPQGFHEPEEMPDFAGDEDQDISLNGLSVSDVDVAETEGGTLAIVLSVDNGSLAITLAGDAAFARGTGNGESRIILVGTQEDLNTSLDSLIYRGDENFNGEDTLHMLVSDRGNTGSGGVMTDEKDFTIDVQAINDAPVLTVPESFSATEDVALALSGISFTDVDAAGSEMRLILEVQNGSLSLGDSAQEANFRGGTSDGDSRIVLRGTLTELNSWLMDLEYTSDENFNGEDSLFVRINDQGNTGDGGIMRDTETVPISVSAVNDAPVIGAPESFMAMEDIPLDLDGISINDVDANDGDGNNRLKLTLEVDNGTLSLDENARFRNGTGNDESKIVVRGTLAELEDWLEELTYTGNENFNGDDNLSIMVNDRGNNGSGGNQTDQEDIDITVKPVNDAPVPDAFMPLYVSSSNEDIVFRYEARDVNGDGSAVTEGAMIASWQDKSGNNLDANLPNGGSTAPNFDSDGVNGMPGLNFGLGETDDMDLLSPPKNNLIGQANSYPEKTIIVTFEVGPAPIQQFEQEMDDFQVIYEQGGASAGYNITIVNGVAYAAAWNTKGNWNQTGTTKVIELGEVESGQTYTAALVHDANYDGGGALFGYLNGTLQGTSENVPAQQKHNNNIGIGNTADETFHPVNLTAVESNSPFRGSISHLTSWNRALLPAEVAVMLMVVNGMMVNDSQAMVVTNDLFNTMDIDNPPSEVTYTVSMNGGEEIQILEQVEMNNIFFAHVNNPTSSITSFTQADIDAGRILIVNDSEIEGPNSAMFHVEVSDGLIPETIDMGYLNVAIANPINGTSGNDVLIGTENQDYLNGMEGIDSLSGNGGADVLDGGLGADILLGGAGNDVLIADFSDTLVDGGAGDNDILRVDSAVTTVNLPDILEGQTMLNMERISLTGDGQTLDINSASLQSITDGNNTLHIDHNPTEGNDAATVRILNDSDWTPPTQMAGDHDIYVDSFGNTLKIEGGINVVFGTED